MPFVDIAEHMPCISLAVVPYQSVEARQMVFWSEKFLEATINDLQIFDRKIIFHPGQADQFSRARFVTAGDQGVSEVQPTVPADGVAPTEPIEHTVIIKD